MFEILGIELTEECIADCPHCFRSKTGRVMNGETLKKIMDEAASHKISFIVFTGGEPFLERDLLFEGARLANLYKIPFAVNTTFFPATQSDIEDLAKLDPFRTTVSVHASDAAYHDKVTGIEGSFEKVVRDIQLASDLKIVVFAHMVVTASNVGRMKETARFFYDLDAGFMATRVGGGFGRFLNRESYLKYLEYCSDLIGEGISVGHDDCYPLCGMTENPWRAKHDCPGGSTMVTVNPEGIIRPCARMPHLSCGSISEGLEKAWTATENWRNRSLLPGACHGCEKLSACGGGCRAEALFAMSAINSIDPYSG